MRKLVPIISFSLFLLLTCCYCNSSRKPRLIREGNEIAAKIESFRQANRRLPDSLREIGVGENEAGPIYFEKKSATKYWLWFKMELGESVTYDSEYGTWKP